MATSKQTKTKKAVKSPAKKTVKKQVVKKSEPKKAVKKTTKKEVKKTAAKKTITKKNVAKVAPKKSQPKFMAHSTKLKEGDKAPTFKGIDQFGKEIALESLKGKNIVLYFYPKDNTPGCTLEACSLRDEHQYLSKQNYVVIGVSADDVKSHKKFSDKFNLPFSLLPDTDKSIIKAYDVWGKKMFMGRIFDGIIRTTFIINEKGIISKIIKEVDTKNHGKQVLA